jgi:8-oxo-dGTP pyrophosphatase MutT (NUDIX family)
MVESGESAAAGPPCQTAVRELREEAGFATEDLAFAGFARFILGAECQTEYAAVYAARVTLQDDRFTRKQ